VAPRRLTWLGFMVAYVTFGFALAALLDAVAPGWPDPVRMALALTIATAAALWAERRISMSSSA
jgi:hypothetical protein